MTWDKKERRKGNQDIISRLGDIEIQIAVLSGETKASHKSYREFELEMRELNKKIVTTVYGNGQAGLTTKVNSIDALKRDLETHSSNDLKLALVYVAAFLGLVAKVLFF